MSFFLFILIILNFYLFFRCLKGLRPYHGLLLMTDRKKLLENLPTDSSPSIVRLINMYNPVKSLQTLSADADLTLAQVIKITLSNILLKFMYFFLF